MLRSALLKYKLGLWRKRRINGPVPPLEESKEKVPLPPEAQPIDGADVEAMEREPVVIDASRLLE